MGAAILHQSDGTVDMLDLGSSAVRREGSSPSFGTLFIKPQQHEL